MATHPRTASVTLDDFLAAQEASEERSELVDGQIVAMGGASLGHGLIVTNLSAALTNALREGPCRVLSQGMLVKASHAENAFLPDVLVYCGAPHIERRRGELLLNPVVIVEVLSESTADYDHVKKWENYRRIPSLQDYLLVAQDEPRVERYTRQEGGMWLFSETVGMDGSVRLESIGTTLSLAETYRGVLSPGGEPL
ncbi:MAG TPA: Uma2 family endonuclease [Longimicrobium sp.]|nr:Uma2 family endonuclease [Longimicrobium sp.]